MSTSKKIMIERNIRSIVKRKQGRGSARENRSAHFSHCLFRCIYFHIFNRTGVLGVANIIIAIGKMLAIAIPGIYIRTTFSALSSFVTILIIWIKTFVRNSHHLLPLSCFKHEFFKRAIVPPLTCSCSPVT